jgi:hypothetical protein
MPSNNQIFHIEELILPLLSLELNFQADEGEDFQVHLFDLHHPSVLERLSKGNI